MDQPRTILRASLRSALALALLATYACDGGTGVDGPQNVAVNFRVVTSTGAAAAQAPLSPAVVASDGPAAVVGPPMVIEGTNGTLRIDEIRLIVAEVELDSDDDRCGGTGDDDGSVDDDDCDFEAPPAFMDIPLDGEPVRVLDGLIAPGTYDELEFEIEDLEDDEEDAEFAAEIATLRERILDEFPDWPRKATALVVGVFDSPETGAVSFRVYLEAEIEVERRLTPALVVGADGGVEGELTVDIMPHLWFTRSDGSVMPLHVYDFDTTGEVLEFEVEMEHGFVEIEID
jgi:hypothetical protein